MVAVYTPSYTVHEEHASQSEDWSIDGRACKARLRCAYADRHAIMKDILENLRPWPYGSWARPPLATSGTITPVPAKADSDGQGLLYDDAILEVNYSHNIRKDAVSGDIVSESIEPTAEFQKLPNRWFRWGAAGTGTAVSPDEAPGILRRGFNLVRTHYNLVAISSSLLTLAGTCNATAYTSPMLGLTFPPETLLFGVPTTNLTIRTDGTEGYTLTLKFTFKAEGWNRFFRARIRGYDQIYPSDGSQPYKPYPPADFSSYLY